MALNLKEKILSFKAPMKIGEELVTEKKFLCGNVDGHAFEFSTLPGLHQENYEATKVQVLKILPLLQKSHKNLILEKPFFGLIEHAHLPPSAIFALESWLFKRAGLEKVAPWNLPVTQNALLLSPSIESLEHARDRGLFSFKIKIGRGESANDLSRLCDHLHPHERVRLDGNRLMNSTQLEALLKDLKDYWHHIDYIEEPFSSLEETQKWQHQVKLALDESLANYLVKSLPNSVCGVVLKPALFGFARSISLIKYFNQQGHCVTLSSCFETHTGLAAISALASLQNSFQPNPAGLDTLQFFK